MFIFCKLNLTQIWHSCSFKCASLSCRSSQFPFCFWDWDLDCSKYRLHSWRRILYLVFICLYSTAAAASSCVSNPLPQQWLVVVVFEHSWSCCCFSVVANIVKDILRQCDETVVQHLQLTLLFCSCVSGGSERAAGKPSLSLRPQQLSVNSLLQPTTQSDSQMWNGSLDKLEGFCFFSIWREHQVSVSFRIVLSRAGTGTQW